MTPVWTTGPKVLVSIWSAQAWSRPTKPYSTSASGLRFVSARPRLPIRWISPSLIVLTDDLARSGVDSPVTTKVRVRPRRERPPSSAAGAEATSLVRWPGSIRRIGPPKFWDTNETPSLFTARLSGATRCRARTVGAGASWASAGVDGNAPAETARAAAEARSAVSRVRVVGFIARLPQGGVGRSRDGPAILGRRT